MTNGIRIRQNHAKTIDILASQKQLYREEAGAIDGLGIILSTGMPVLLAILLEIFSE
ncbi:TPA: hypothetical protein QFG62_001104 [Enterococcus faecium]|uniref:hypothetical protein n=1 Tax=Enterococcus faecium TaxID=1352 RepID=UPI000B6C4FA5|nr:hypothetical protein [Enterococcus faecium]EMF0353968.1 hypothetical protein [Enterococcus faecium]MBK1310254.1 hypothetical protein [Enterococcus faecium]MDW7854069.1 hypothetical protein [Enterococcus faecium]OTO06814.1 hypothetical protein A5801_000853 [Enterococcus faecium]